MNLGQLLFNFSGRINRAKWWLTILISVIIQFVLYGLILAIQSEGIANVLSFVVAILLIWVALAAGTKRLHDLNRSGAWLVLFIGGPILLIITFFGFAGMAAGASLLAGQELDPAEIARIGGIALILGVLYLALLLWALIWFGCLRGTVGPNQYGPDPLEGREAFR